MPFGLKSNPLCGSSARYTHKLSSLIIAGIRILKRVEVLPGKYLPSGLQMNCTPQPLSYTAVARYQEAPWPHQRICTTVSDNPEVVWSL
jgi:hypothetical protein